MFSYTIVLFVLLKGVSGPNEVKSITSVPLVAQKCWINPELLLDLPFTEKDLGIYCRHYLDYYKCVDKHRREFQEDQLNLLTFMLAKAEPFMRKKLCRKTPINHSYKLHASCLKTVSQQFDFCLKLAKNLVKKYMTLETKPNNLMAVSSNCLYASVSLTCLEISISKTCGPDAKKLYIQIFEGTKFYSHCCPEFQYKYAAKRSRIIWVETGMNICDLDDRKCYF